LPSREWMAGAASGRLELLRKTAMELSWDPRTAGRWRGATGAGA
jgi:hypothetical protein